MSTLQENASYLNGLAEGMELDASKKENKLILKMLDLIGQMAERIDELEDYIDELDAKVDEIDQDLGEMESDYYDDSSCDCCDDDDDYDYDDLDDDVYEFTCDHCGDTVYIDGDLDEEEKNSLP